MTSYGQQRRWQRLPLRIPIFVEPGVTRGTATMEFAAALDIGAGGALLHTQTFYPLNSTLILRIPLSPAIGQEHREQRMRARVLRLEVQKNGFRVAVEFAKPLIVEQGACQPEVQLDGVMST